MSCAQCRHWRIMDGVKTQGGAVGQCRRNPPTVHIVTIIETAKKTVLTAEAPMQVASQRPQQFWPLTLAVEDCGEYADKDMTH